MSIKYWNDFVEVDPRRRVVVVRVVAAVDSVVAVVEVVAVVGQDFLAVRYFDFG